MVTTAGYTTPGSSPTPSGTEVGGAEDFAASL